MKARPAFILVPIILLLAASSLVIGQLILLASQAYQNADRNTLMAEGMLIAESELEYMFYVWEEKRFAGDDQVNPKPETANEEIPDISFGPNVAWKGMPDDKAYPYNLRELHPTRDQIQAKTYNSWMTPYLGTVPGKEEIAKRWQVVRTLQLIRFENGKTTATGDTNDEVGDLTRYEALVTVSSLDPAQHDALPPITVQVGRRFSEGSIYINGLTYDGKLEFSAGSAINVTGSVTSNSDIYLTARGEPDDLKVKGRVKSTGKVNGIDAAASNAGDASAPGYDNYFDTDGVLQNDDVGFYNPSWTTDGAAVQISKLTSAKNLTGLNPVRLANDPVLKSYFDRNPDGTVATDAQRVNNARHMVIDPSTGADEPPVIASHRMYNKAGIRIQIGVGGDPTAITATDNDGNSISGAELAAIKTAVLGSSGAPGTTPAAPGETYTVRSDIYDAREKKVVKVTTLDVGALKSALAANSGLEESYNGIVYIHDLSEDGAIRLINGASIPGADIVKDGVTTEGDGFSVVTDKALYVQGNYNNGTEIGSAAFMSDVVTVLSSNWKDANATQDLVEKALSVETRKAADITINAGILTGNTATTASAKSGGVQNLVRLMEDWTGRTTTFSGSFAQIFESTHFKAGMRTDFYKFPTTRNFDFRSFAAASGTSGGLRPAKGLTLPPEFSRGDFFIFNR